MSTHRYWEEEKMRVNLVSNSDSIVLGIGWGKDPSFLIYCVAIGFIYWTLLFSWDINPTKT